jgi:hypothetical protein
LLLNRCKRVAGSAGMAYNRLERDFVIRTLDILHNYKGPYGVTLLINCLLGLIVLPTEKNFEGILEEKGIQLADLGISSSELQSWGKIEEQKRTIMKFVHCLRNSIAHIRVESFDKDGEIKSLCFSDKSGFKAVFSIERMKEIVEKLANIYID